MNMMTRFFREEDGVALTEYVVLLALLVAALIAAVGFFGDSLAAVFSGWGSWVQDKCPEGQTCVPGS